MLCDPEVVKLRKPGHGVNNNKRWHILNIEISPMLSRKSPDGDKTRDTTGSLWWLLRNSPRELRGPDLEGGPQAVEVLRHAAGVVGCGAADALDHVDAIAALATDRAVVLRAAEVHAALCHLRVCQPVHTPAPHAHSLSTLG